MKILIIGGGVISGILAKEFSFSGHSIRIARRNLRDPEDLPLDLLAENPFMQKDLGQPDLVIVCAGMTNLAEIQCNPLASEKINVYGLRRAIDSIPKSSFVVFISSSAVFDGQTQLPNEDASVNPTCEYGRQKVAVEEYIQQSRQDRSLIVRLTKLVHNELPIVKSWEKRFSNGVAVNPFSDLKLSPVTPKYLADSVLTLASARAAGITHLSGERDITYVDLCFEVAKRIGGNLNLIRPVLSNSVSVPIIYKPEYASLGMRATSRFGVSGCQEIL